MRPQLALLQGLLAAGPANNHSSLAGCKHVLLCYVPNTEISVSFASFATNPLHALRTVTVSPHVSH